MPPFNNFTTKAKDAIRRSHELAIERGQNHVGPTHVLAALLLQEESMVLTMLEKMDVDTILLTESALDLIEGTTEGQTVQQQTFQMYLTPELAQMFDAAVKIAQSLQEQFISTEHMLLALFDVPGEVQELLAKFKIKKISISKDMIVKK